MILWPFHRLTVTTKPRETYYECSCGQSQGWFESPLHVPAHVRRRKARSINRLAHRLETA